MERADHPPIATAAPNELAVVSASSHKAKPLKQKAYGSIPHLPGSRMGPADHHCHEGQARICTERVRDRHDQIIVEEKLDGSCVSAARIGDEILALGRAGHLASSSPYEQHHLFADWVAENADRFREILRPGERAVGEWLAQAHGTRYDLTRREPFVLFDVMQGHERLTWSDRTQRAIAGMFYVPFTLSAFNCSMSIPEVLDFYERKGSHHGALGPVEGAVWRVERLGKVDFLCKWVRPDKMDGSLLPEITGCEPVWNWRPAQTGGVQ